MKDRVQSGMAPARGATTMTRMHRPAKAYHGSGRACPCHVSQQICLPVSFANRVLYGRPRRSSPLKDVDPIDIVYCLPHADIVPQAVDISRGGAVLRVIAPPSISRCWMVLPCKDAYCPVPPVVGQHSPA